jgi:plasmid maintenance system antidote protein VapI
MTQIVNGRLTVSVENAFRLDRYLGAALELWLNNQTDGDLRLVQRGEFKAITEQFNPILSAV